MKVRCCIEDMPFTLLRGADKDKLKKLRTLDGKVRWLKERVKLVLINPFHKALVEDWEKDQLGMFLVSGLCAGISAAATFYKGKSAPKGKDKAYFCEFVSNYIRPFEPELGKRPKVQWIDPNRQPNNWAEWLYLYVRCGLAHAFVIEQGGFHKSLNSLISQADDPNEPVVAADRLLEAFDKGWSKYLSDVCSDGAASDKGEKFLRRWNELFAPQPEETGSKSGAGGCRDL